MFPAAAGLLLAGLVLAGLTAPGRSEKLVFSEDFNSLDESRWVHQISAWRGGNQEFQYYRNDRKNSYVRDGILYIRPTLTADEYGEDFLQHGNLSYPGCNMDPCVSQAGTDEIVLPIQSARLSTMGKFSFRYGRLEVRARLPRGDWIWPAIWLLPQKDVYGGWPRSGEIDLMESKGNAHLTDDQGRHQGIRRMGSTLHFGPAWNKNRYDKAHFDKSADSDTLADDFHVYCMEWSENGFKFMLDGQLIGEIPPPKGGFWELGEFEGKDIWSGKRMAPFDEEFYIIMNVAVGGTFFGDHLKNSPHPRPYDLSSGKAMRQFWEKKDWWLSTWEGEKAALQVDYVRVYQAE